MKKTLALIFGGEGAEREISEMSASHLISSLNDDVLLLKIGISPTGDWFLFEGDEADIKNGKWLNSQSLTPVFPARFNGKSAFYKQNGEAISIDLAFPILHGDFGEDGRIQGALDTAHIPYIGSSVISSSITTDKAYTKIIAEYLSIPTLPWFIPNSKAKSDVRREAERRLGYPFFIKPRQLGSSIGASPVYSRQDFDKAFNEAAACSDGLIMIERLAGIKAELEYALFDGDVRFITNPGVISGVSFYDFDSKYANDSAAKARTTGFEDKAASRKAKSMARKIADFLMLGNLSRIDFFYTASGEIYFNEINSIPGTTESSLYPRLVESHGKFKSSFLLEIIKSKTC